jgi:hypothetical protein
MKCLLSLVLEAEFQGLRFGWMFQKPRLVLIHLNSLVRSQGIPKFKGHDRNTIPKLKHPTTNVEGG